MRPRLLLIQQECFQFISATSLSVFLYGGFWKRRAWWHNESLNETHTSALTLLHDVPPHSVTMATTLCSPPPHVHEFVCVTCHFVPCRQINSLPDSFPVNSLKQKVSVLISWVQRLASSFYLCLALTFTVSLSPYLTSSFRYLVYLKRVSADNRTVIVCNCNNQ